MQYTYSPHDLTCIESQGRRAASQRRRVFLRPERRRPSCPALIFLYIAVHNGRSFARAGKSELTTLILSVSTIVLIVPSAGLASASSRTSRSNRPPLSNSTSSLLSLLPAGLSTPLSCPRLQLRQLPSVWWVRPARRWWLYPLLSPPGRSRPGTRRTMRRFSRHLLMFRTHALSIMLHTSMLDLR